MDLVELISKHYDAAKTKEEKLVLRGILVGQHLAKNKERDSFWTEKYLKLALNKIIEDEVKNN